MSIHTQLLVTLKSPGSFGFRYPRNVGWQFLRDFVMTLVKVLGRTFAEYWVIAYLLILWLDRGITFHHSETMLDQVIMRGPPNRVQGRSQSKITSDSRALLKGRNPNHISTYGCSHHFPTIFPPFSTIFLQLSHHFPPFPHQFPGVPRATPSPSLHDARNAFGSRELRYNLKRFPGATLLLR